MMIRERGYAMHSELGLITSKSMQSSWASGHKRSRGDLGVYIRMDAHHNAQATAGYYGIQNDAPSAQYYVIPESDLLPIIDDYYPIDKMAVRTPGLFPITEPKIENLPPHINNTKPHLTVGDLNKVLQVSVVQGYSHGGGQRQHKMIYGSNEYGSWGQVAKELSKFSFDKIDINLTIGLKGHTDIDIYYSGSHQWEATVNSYMKNIQHAFQSVGISPDKINIQINRDYNATNSSFTGDTK